MSVFYSRPPVIPRCAYVVYERPPATGDRCTQRSAFFDPEQFAEPGPDIYGDLKPAIPFPPAVSLGLPFSVGRYFGGLGYENAVLVLCHGKHTFSMPVAQDRISMYC